MKIVIAMLLVCAAAWAQPTPNPGDPLPLNKAATNFQKIAPALNRASSYAGSNITLEFAGSNQNLNAQANLAGAVDVRLCIEAVP